MTLSIAARCPRTRQVGVAAITHMVGIGKLVTHARSGIGAVATQGEMNPYHGIDALARMAEGRCPREALEPLVRADAGREERQSAAVDTRGRAWAWTGSDLPDWKGHRCGDGWTVQGNRLTGSDAVDATAAAFADEADAHFESLPSRAAPHEPPSRSGEPRPV